MMIMTLQEFRIAEVIPDGNGDEHRVVFEAVHQDMLGDDWPKNTRGMKSLRVQIARYEIEYFRARIGRTVTMRFDVP